MAIVSRLKNGGVWIPAQDADSDWLLITLHGSGGSGHDFDTLDAVLNIPKLNYLYLNGPIRSFSSYMWYDSSDSRHDAYAILEETLSLCDREGYPPERTFLLGFSQGAALTFEFGARYKHLLAGYIAISGRIEGLASLMNQANREIVKQGRWLVTHGTEDYNLSIDIMRQQVEQLRSIGFHIEFREYPKIHEMDAKEELQDVREWILEHMNQRH
ncbi:MAG: serine esterase [Chlamydiales bacterium]|nr:serine esterase [Chlamydiia bacterium]MCP5507535.1 serine esterase [Chlamydiales bacterium]